MSTNVITRTWLQLYYYEYISQVTFDIKDVNLNSLEYFTYFRGLRLWDTLSSSGDKMSNGAV